MDDEPSNLQDSLASHEENASAGESSPAQVPKKKRRIADLSAAEIDEILALKGKLSQSAIGKKFGIEQTEVSQIHRSQKSRVTITEDNKNRIKALEIAVPIAYGSVAQWLGKRAHESHSHRWTVYVRSSSNEDLGDVISKVVFQLHNSFENPTRVVEEPPFELTETGWGEFEIGITIYPHVDAAEKPVEVYHMLKLYPQESGNQRATKKPVVVETYDEFVFFEPVTSFFHRVKNLPAVVVSGTKEALDSAFSSEATSTYIAPIRTKSGDTKSHSLTHLFKHYTDEEEMRKLTESRRQIQATIKRLTQDFELLQSECDKMKSLK